MKGKYWLAATACFSLTSYAGTMGAHATHNAGWTIGADIGYGYLSTQEEDLLSPVSITVPATPEIQSQSHHLGDLIGSGYLGYNFSVLESLLMGVEVGYKYLGQSRYKSYAQDTISNSFFDNDIKVTQQAVDFLLASRFYVSRDFSFIGKAGAAYVYSDTKSSSNFNLAPFVGGLPTDVSIWRIKPEFSLGVGYALSSSVDLNLTYTHIGGVDTNVTGLFRYYSITPDKLPAVFEYNGLALGLSYRFGSV